MHIICGGGDREKYDWHATRLLYRRDQERSTIYGTKSNKWNRKKSLLARLLLARLRWRRPSENALLQRRNESHRINNYYYSETKEVYNWWGEGKGRIPRPIIVVVKGCCRRVLRKRPPCATLSVFVQYYIILYTIFIYTVVHKYKPHGFHDYRERQRGKKKCENNLRRTQFL